MVDFDLLKPTTMTLVAQLAGWVNLDWAFSLLPITQVNLPEQNRRKQKIKLPHVDTPGAILSLRHKGHTRGIIRSSNRKFFKNSITIDIATREKNLCMKLSLNKFQICGATSLEQGREGCQYVIDALLAIQKELNYIADNREKAVTTLRLLKELTKGEELLRPETESTSMSLSTEAGLTPSRQVSDFAIRRIGDLSVYASEDFDVRIANFLYRQAADFSYHSHFATEIDFIVLMLRHLVSEDLAIASICEVMVNLNYDLGFDVDRAKFCRLLNLREGFFARYNNMLEHSVTVHLPYEPDETRALLRKKSKPPCHTFIVYHSGLVTQSGPGGQLMREAYYKFNEVVARIRDQVMVDQPRKLKYVPVSMDVSA